MQDVAFKNTIFFIFWKWKLCKGNPILYLISGKMQRELLKKHFMRKRIWIHRCMYSRKIIMQLLLMKPIRNFWQKYWQIQRCGRCSIHWQRRWSNKFYIQMSIFIVHMENLSPSNLLKSPSFSIKMMEIDWQRVTIGWSSPKVEPWRNPFEEKG